MRLDDVHSEPRPRSAPSRRDGSRVSSKFAWPQISTVAWICPVTPPTSMRSVAPKAASVGERDRRSTGPRCRRRPRAAARRTSVDWSPRRFRGPGRRRGIPASAGVRGYPPAFEGAADVRRRTITDPASETSGVSTSGGGSTVDDDTFDDPRRPAAGTSSVRVAKADSYRHGGAEQQALLRSHEVGRGQPRASVSPSGRSSSISGHESAGDRDRDAVRRLAWPGSAPRFGTAISRPPPVQVQRRLRRAGREVGGHRASAAPRGRRAPAVVRAPSSTQASVCACGELRPLRSGGRHVAAEVVVVAHEVRPGRPSCPLDGV